LFVLFLILFSSYCFSQNDPPPWGNVELGINNNSGYLIKAQLYPISTIFNRDGYMSLISSENARSYPFTFTGYNSVYSNGTSFITTNNGLNWDKIVIFDIPSSSTSIPGWDEDLASNSSAFGIFGYGTYKLILEYVNHPLQTVDSVILEVDYYEPNEVGEVYLYINYSG